MTRLPFRQQMLRAREDAILASVNRLLADKGFDLMTVDEVAADVGIAKASLYKHFRSKEDLAAAAMVRALDRALAQVQALAAQPLAPRERLRAITRWAMEQQLAGEMPSLPAENSALRAALVAHKPYVDRLMELSERLGEWITAAQQQGEIDPRLPPEVVLYTLYARACDPVLGVLRAGGNYGDAEIVDLVLATCFDGLGGGAAVSAR